MRPWFVSQLLPCTILLVVLCAATVHADDLYRLRDIDWRTGDVTDETEDRLWLFERIERLVLPEPQDVSFDWDEEPNPALWRGQDEAEVTLVALPGPGVLFGGARVRGEWGSDFNNDDRIGGHLLWLTRSQFAIDAEANHRQTVRFHKGQEKDRELWNGDANLVYQLPNVKMLAMRVGGGVNWLHDNDETDVGWNLTYAAEVFVKGPWLVTGEIDYGGLAGERLFHGQATLGVRLNRFEIFTGYDFFELGGMEIDGLIGGAGIWF